MPISTAQIGRLWQLANDTRLSQRRRPASQRDVDALALANGTIAALDEIERQATEIERLRTELNAALRWCDSYLVIAPEILMPALRDGLRDALAPSPAKEGVTSDK